MTLRYIAPCILDNKIKLGSWNTCMYVYMYLFIYFYIHYILYSCILILKYGDSDIQFAYKNYGVNFFQDFLQSQLSMNLYIEVSLP